ncbi:flagellar motor switch protein FliN [Deltaproteobacteria bacterium TL4]
MGEMTQEEIDALLGGGPAASTPASSGEMDQSDIDALLNGTASVSVPSGEMDQSDIDALLNGAASVSVPSGDMDQSDIDALLSAAADGFGVDHSAAKHPVAASSQMDQGDIDALLAMSSVRAEGETEEIDDLSLDGDMASLLAEIQNDTSMSNAGGEVNIDDLLTEIQTDSALSSGGSFAKGGIQSLIDSAKTSAAPLAEEEEPGVNVDFLLDMKLTLTFEVGRSKMLISDLLSLGQGSVIELHRLVGEDLDLFVSGKLIAKGEVVVVNEKFGVRIINIVTPQQRIQLMGGMDKLS